MNPRGLPWKSPHSCGGRTRGQYATVTSGDSVLGATFWAPHAESRRTKSSVEEALAEGTYHKNCGCPGTQRPRRIRYIFSASQGVYLNPPTLFSGKVTSQGRRTTIRGFGPEEASSCEDPSGSTAPVLAARWWRTPGSRLAGNTITSFSRQKAPPRPGRLLDPL